MGHFKDVREHLEALDKAGLLVKIDEAINKDTELMPLVRWQFRGLPEEERLSADRLVGDLLLLAQAESGQVPFDMVPIELDSILLEVFQQMKILAGERQKVLLTDIDQIVVKGDRDRLKQVLLNLLSNALRYAQGQIRVEVQATPSGAQARISDVCAAFRGGDGPNRGGAS